MTEKEYKDAVAKIIERLFTKDEVVAMLKELQLEIEKSPCKYSDRLGDYSDGVQKGIDIIQQRINTLKGVEDGNDNKS